MLCSEPLLSVMDLSLKEEDAKSTTKSMQTRRRRRKKNKEKSVKSDPNLTEEDTRSESNQSKMSCSETLYIAQGSEADHEIFMEEEETKSKPKSKTKRLESKTKRLKSKTKKSKGKSVKEEESDSEQERDEYYPRYEEIEGFDVPDPPFGTFLCIAPEDNLEHPHILESAKFAVDEQNKIEVAYRLGFAVRRRFQRSASNHWKMSCLETLEMIEGSEADVRLMVEAMKWRWKWKWKSKMRSKMMKRTGGRMKIKGKYFKEEESDSEEEPDAYVDEELEMLKGPKVRFQLDEYYRRYEESEGFDVPDPPFGTFLCIAPKDNLEHPDILESTNFVVVEYNRKEKKKIKFIRVVKAMVQGVAGILYYLTIEVKDDVRDSFICQAKVYDSVQDFALERFREVPINQDNELQ